MAHPLSDDPERTVKRDVNQPTPARGPDPHPAVDPNRLPAAPGYQIHAEIARGGMGLVLSAQDLGLDRLVAIKTFRADKPALVGDTRRFEREIRVTARLSHPGVPPVYGRGTLTDGRPFLAMKLVAGQTLAQLLRERAGPGADQPRFIDVYEQVCHTVGYAHSQSVIHRDLKPSNVMVGAFGEVHVMDWGLAKLSSSGSDLEGDESDPESTAELPLIEGEDTPSQQLTQRGQAVGTPAYIAPEQARGEVGMLDARADVFALGGILCAILTGRPTFTGGTDAAISAARTGAVGDTLARLDACGADAELIALAKRCLAPGPAQRPADGEEVAAAVAAYRASVEARLRKAEADRAAAEARAAEEANTRREAEARLREQRRKRRWQVLTAAALSLLLAGGAGFAWWRDAQARERREKADRSRETVRAGLEQANALRSRYSYDDADRLLATLRAQAESDVPDLVPTVEQAWEDTTFARELDTIRYSKWLWVPTSGQDGEFNTASAARNYAAAFERRGFSFANANPTTLANKLNASPLRSELIAALDDWSLFEKDEALRERVLEVARFADPDPWLNRFRTPKLRADGDRLALLAREGQLPLTPAVVVTLAKLMSDQGLDPSGILETASLRQPTDFSLVLALALYHSTRDPDRAIGFYRAALALRPNQPVALSNLGTLLSNKQDFKNAEFLLRASVKAEPAGAVSHYNLGSTLISLRQYDEAIRESREAARLDPLLPHPHNTLGRAFQETGKLPEAIAEYREALRLGPGFAFVHYNLAQALAEQKQFKEAADEYRLAIKLAPGLSLAYYGLGVLLRDHLNDAPGAIDAFRAAIKADPKSLEARVNLANLLLARGEVADALATYRAALAVRSNSAIAQNGEGLALKELAARGGVLAAACSRAAALAAYRRAAELDTAWADPPYNAGVVHLEAGEWDQAAAAYREAIRRNPAHVNARMNLGVVLLRSDMPAALEEFLAAYRLDPRNANLCLKVAEVQSRLGRPEEALATYDRGLAAAPNEVSLVVGRGLALRNLGRFKEAIEAFREAQKLTKDPSQLRVLTSDISDLEKLMAFDARAADIFAGKEKAKGWQEWADVAVFSTRFKRRYADAVRAYREAFELNPAIARDPNNLSRMNAAWAAAMAAAGAGADPPPAGERAKYRRWAYEYLRDDLATFAEGNRVGVPGAGVFTHNTMSAWLTDPAFARLRHPLHLAALPPGEATRWLNFWKQVRAWRDKTAPTIPPPREVEAKSP